MLELLLLPTLAGLCIAALAGPFGCFLVWRRMAFFADTLAHGALPGVAIALWLDVNVTITVVISSVALVFVLLGLERRSHIPPDTMLAVLAHSALAIGILGVVMAGSRGPGLESFLLGDLLTVAPQDLVWIGIAALLLGAALLRYWRQWLALAVHEELARVDGLAVDRLRLLQQLLTAILVALAIRTVGVLMVSALLILPAAGVRKLVSSPLGMALGASVLGCVSVITGLAGSWIWDTPAGPSVVASASLLFLIIQMLPARNPWPSRTPQ